MWMHAPHCTANIYTVIHIHTLEYISDIRGGGEKGGEEEEESRERKAYV